MIDVDKLKEALVSIENEIEDQTLSILFLEGVIHDHGEKGIVPSLIRTAIVDLGNGRECLKKARAKAFELIERAKRDANAKEEDLL